MNIKIYTKSTLRWKTFLLSVCSSVLVFTAAAQAPKNKKIHIGLVYPLSSNGSHAPLDTNDISFNLIAGVSAAEHGPAIAGLSNIVRQDAKNVTIAGFSNHIGRNAEGVLVAGALNTYKNGNGVAIAGFGNIAFGNVSGFQLAGFGNVSKNADVQISGFLNKANAVSSLQVGGFMNLSKDTKGSQIAGFMNIARKVKGVQISAFMNIADSSDYPIGIINLVKHGEKSISATIDENRTTMLSFRSGGKILYGIIGIGYNFKNTDAVYAFEAGLGAHTFEYKNFRLNLEITSSTLTGFKRVLSLELPPRSRHGEYWKSSLSLLPSYKIGNRFEIFGGPSLNFVSTNTVEGADLNKSYINKWENQDKYRIRGLYVGYKAGVQVIL